MGVSFSRRNSIARITSMMAAAIMILSLKMLTVTMTPTIIESIDPKVDATSAAIRIGRSNNDTTVVIVKNWNVSYPKNSCPQCGLTWAASVLTLIDYDDYQSDSTQIKRISQLLSVINSTTDNCTYQTYHSVCYEDFRNCTTQNQPGVGNDLSQLQEKLGHRVVFNNSLNSDSEFVLDIDLSQVINRCRVVTLFSFDAKFSLRNDSTMETVDDSEVRITDVVFLLRERENVDNVIHEYLEQHFPAFLFFEPSNVAILRETLLKQIETKSEEKLHLTRLANEAAADVIQIFARLNIGIGETVTSFDDMTSYLHENPYGDSAPFLLFNFLTLDVTDKDSFQDIFPRDQIIDRIKMEHVVEHLTLPEAIIAFKNCFQYLRPGGLLRIAVPDYSWSIANCSIVETISELHMLSDCELNLLKQDRLDKHRVRYSLDSLRSILSSVGFEVRPLEWCDNNGQPQIDNWSISDGFIDRSSKGSSSSLSRSLIVDAIKPHTLVRSQLRYSFQIAFEVDTGMSCSAFVVYCKALLEILPLMVKELIAQNLLHVRIILDILLSSSKNNTNVYSGGIPDESNGTESPCPHWTIDAEIDSLITLIADYDYLTKYVSISRRGNDWKKNSPAISNVTVLTTCKEKNNDYDADHNSIVLLLDNQSECIGGCEQKQQQRNIITIFDQSNRVHANNNTVIQSRLGFNPLLFYMDTPEDILIFRRALFQTMKSLTGDNYVAAKVIPSYIAVIYDSESNQTFSQLYLWAVRTISDYESNKNIPFSEKLCIFIVGGILTTQEYEYLKNSKVTFWHVLGTVKPDMKRKIYSGAIAALNMHKEPLLSLLSLEAMACGCPIIAMYDQRLIQLILSIYSDVGHHLSTDEPVEAISTLLSSHLTNGTIHLMHSTYEGFEFRNAIRQLHYSGHGHGRGYIHVVNGGNTGMEQLTQFDLPEAAYSRKLLSFKVKQIFTGWRNLTMSIFNLIF